jgi:hypothetical protein
MVGCLVFLDMLLLLLPLMTTLAFDAITASCTVGLQLAYAIPILQRAWGGAGDSGFERGKFHLGRWSVLVGWVGGVWLLVTSAMLFLPPVWPVTGQNMNYTCAVVGSVAVWGAVFWQLHARHVFKGPRHYKEEARW